MPLKGNMYVCTNDVPLRALLYNKLVSHWNTPVLPNYLLANSCNCIFGWQERQSWECHNYVCDTPARPRFCQPYSRCCLEILLIPISENWHSLMLSL